MNPESPNPYQITGVAQNRDGSWFLTAGNQEDAVAFNRTDFTPSQFLDTGPFTDITLSTDDIYLAVAGEQVWVYPLTRNQFILDSIAITDENNGLGYQLAFNPNNSLLAYVSEESLSLWGTTELENLASVIYPLAGNFLGQPVSLDYSPYGNLIGLGMENGLILIFGIPASVAE